MVDIFIFVEKCHTGHNELMYVSNRPRFAISAYALVTTTIRLRFDGHLTLYQRSLRSQRAAVTLTYLFT